MPETACRECAMLRFRLDELLTGYFSDQHPFDERRWLSTGPGLPTTQLAAVVLWHWQAAINDTAIASFCGFLLHAMVAALSAHSRWMPDI